jgi:hypothetical protein
MRVSKTALMSSSCVQAVLDHYNRGSARTPGDGDFTRLVHLLTVTAPEGTTYVRHKSTTSWSSVQCYDYEWSKTVLAHNMAITNSWRTHICTTMQVHGDYSWRKDPRSSSNDETDRGRQVANSWWIRTLQDLWHEHTFVPRTRLIFSGNCGMMNVRWLRSLHHKSWSVQIHHQSITQSHWPSVTHISSWSQFSSYPISMLIGPISMLIGRAMIKKNCVPYAIIRHPLKRLSDSN